MCSPTVTMYCRQSVSEESTRSDTLSEMASGRRACFRNEVLKGIFASVSAHVGLSLTVKHAKPIASSYTSDGEMIISMFI